MSEEKKELNEQELEKVDGGFGFIPPPPPVPVFIKPKPYYLGPCNECAVAGNMNVPAYAVPGTDIAFCLEKGHIYRGSSYDHCNLDEARSYMN